MWKKPEIKQEADMQLFTVYDKTGKTYGDIVYAKNKDVLLREVLNMFRRYDHQQQNPHYLNAEDFTIFKIGDYQKSTGQITLCDHERIAYMHELKALVEPAQPPASMVQAGTGALLPT